MYTSLLSDGTSDKLIANISHSQHHPLSAAIQLILSLLRVGLSGSHVTVSFQPKYMALKRLVCVSCGLNVTYPQTCETKTV